MSVPTPSSTPLAQVVPSRPLAAVLALAVLVAALAPMLPAVAWRAAGVGPDHLVVSEVVTGGASASDELIELHNPTDLALPLEGLEVIYVTASGATISRRASWALGAPSVPARGHFLIANEAGIYAGIADATYSSGMAATGGSVAIRIQGASSAIDAVGWGNATSSWLEGTPAPAPSAGASIERLPGGAAGSGQDSGDNASDFVVRELPEPQNLLSAPTPELGASPSPTPKLTPTATPSASASPSATATPSPTPTPTPSAQATPSPGPAIVSVADARASADGTSLTIEGLALTSSSFHDGGGFVADASGGIAVLPDGQTFDRGQLVRVSGEIDDRFSQRTLRADPGGILAVGSGSDPEAVTVTTGQLGEPLEGILVRLSGSVLGAPTALTTGLAFDLDDGTGPARIVVGTATGIATGSWTRGTVVTLQGVVGQRDSTGSGVEGYRLMPRDPVDVVAVGPGPSPTPSPEASAGSPSPSASPEPVGVVSIATARQAPPNARLRIRGVVTLQTGVVDDRFAVVQDGTGAIVLRLSGDAGTLARGTRVEVDGARSTFGGMETLRVTKPAGVLGSASEPAALQLATGDANESREALLVVARGAVVASARRSSGGTVSFEIDDGSGPLRVSAGATLGVERDNLPAGTWVEVSGVLGQDTTRAKPAEGYRIWPRSAQELRIVAPATGKGNGEAADGDLEGGGGGGAGGGGPAAQLGAIGSGDLARLRVGATLVIGPWPELNLAGLLWDGRRIVAVHPDSTDVVEQLLEGRRAPIAIELGGLRLAGNTAIGGASVVRLGSAETDTVLLDSVPAPPRGSVNGAAPAWVAVVGRLAGSDSDRTLRVGDDVVRILSRCGDGDVAAQAAAAGSVVVTGIALGRPARLVVPCGGIRSTPSLSSPAGSAATITGQPPDPVAASLASATDPRRGLAAGILLLASIALPAAAWLRRRRMTAGSAETELAPSTATPARLTLVPVRDEHGP